MISEAIQVSQDAKERVMQKSSLGALCTLRVCKAGCPKLKFIPEKESIQVLLLVLFIFPLSSRLTMPIISFFTLYQYFLILIILQGSFL